MVEICAWKKVKTEWYIIYWKYDMFCIVDLEEAALPLDEYTSLREFFVRTLKEGSRPIDPDPRCLVTGNQQFGLLICPICSTLKCF